MNKRPGAYGQSEPQTTGAAARCHAIDRRKTRETALIHAVSSEMRFWYGATPSITDRKHRRPKSGSASGGAASIAASLPQGNRRKSRRRFLIKARREETCENPNRAAAKAAGICRRKQQRKPATEGRRRCDEGCRKPPTEIGGIGHRQKGR